MEITVGDFSLEWKRKDGEIHKADYDDLIKVYEGQKEHDEKIRNKAIDEFAEKLNNKISKFVLQNKDNLDFASGIAVTWNIVDEIAEQMKGVGE